MESKPPVRISYFRDNRQPVSRLQLCGLYRPCFSLVCLVNFVENGDQRDGQSDGSEDGGSLVRDPSVGREELAVGVVARVIGAEAEVHLDLNLD